MANWRKDEWKWWRWMSQRVEWSEKKPSVRALWSLVNLDSSGAVARKGVIISKVTLPSPPSVRRVSSPSPENEPPFPRRDFVSCGHERKRGEIKKRKGEKKKEIREEGVVFSQVSEERKEMAPLLSFSNPHQKEREMSWPVCLSFLAGLLPFLVNNSRGSRYSWLGS